MKVRLSDIYDAVNFNNLDSILSAPVALVISIFFGHFSTFSLPRTGMEKLVFSANFSSQNILSLSKLEGRIGPFFLEATDAKNVLNFDEISE